MAHPDFLWGFFVPANLAAFTLVAIMWTSRRVWLHGLALTALFAIAYNGYGRWEIKGAPAITSPVTAKTGGN